MATLYFREMKRSYDKETSARKTKYTFSLVIFSDQIPRGKKKKMLNNATRINIIPIRHNSSNYPCVVEPSIFI